jgi:hypothetical protein
LLQAPREGEECSPAQLAIYKSRRTSMLPRTPAFGLVCAVALSLCAAAPAAAAGGMKGGGGGVGSIGGGGGISHGGAGPGSVGGIGRGGPGPSSMVSHGPGPGMGTGFPSGVRANTATLHDRDFGRRFDRDHDFDRDRDRFRFRRFFFPRVGFDVYSDIDVYPYEDCYVVRKVWTRFGLRLHRIWVCG